MYCEIYIHIYSLYVLIFDIAPARKSRTEDIRYSLFIEIIYFVNTFSCHLLQVSDRFQSKNSTSTVPGTCTFSTACYSTYTHSKTCTVLLIRRMHVSETSRRPHHVFVLEHDFMRTLYGISCTGTTCTVLVLVLVRRYKWRCHPCELWFLTRMTRLSLSVWSTTTTSCTFHTFWLIKYRQTKNNTLLFYHANYKKIQHRNKHPPKQRWWNFRL